MQKRTSVLCAVRDDRIFRSMPMNVDVGEAYVFHIVHSGSQALRMALDLKPDILIADAVLPGLDGPALVDQLHQLETADQPHVIGGAQMAFARDAFLRRGVECVLNVPWNGEQVISALLAAEKKLNTLIDWMGMQGEYEFACMVLEALGMRCKLHGFEYLSWAAVLTAYSQARLHAIKKRIYVPIAQHFSTTPQNVERLIRHAVERTMDSANSELLYAFFGNTIDPARGKPTNAQMIGMLAQKVRVGKNKE